MAKPKKVIDGEPTFKPNRPDRDKIIEDILANGMGALHRIPIEDLYPISDHMRGVPSEVKTVTAAAEEDLINHPSHYADADIPSGIECWDWYELGMTKEEFRGAMKNNVLKYMWRVGRKGDKTKAVQDLNKAIGYLKRWIKFEEGERTVWMRGMKSDWPSQT